MSFQFRKLELPVISVFIAFVYFLFEQMQVFHTHYFKSNIPQANRSLG